MKANEFIFEDDEFDPYATHEITPRSKTPEIADVKSFADLAARIAANCSEMVAAYKSSGKVLYRGMHTQVPVVITGIRPDRRPVEMDPVAHNNLHKAFLMLGLKATRKNAIFCTTSSMIANSWGSGIYIIFVKDGWSGTIFKKVKADYSFHKLSDWGNNIVDLTQLAMRIQTLGPFPFSSSNQLSDVIRSGYEDILITGDSYIGLKMGSSTCERVFEILGLKR
jgi:hypothetical protein